MKSGSNLFEIGGLSQDAENFLSLFSDERICIERIVSFGQKTGNDQWLVQEENEWVILIQGEAEILIKENNMKVYMRKGDHLFIPSNCKHRVSFTSDDPPCIWLAIHFGTV